MRHLRTVFFAASVLLLIQAACAPQATQAPPPTQAPPATAVPAQPTETQTLVPAPVEPSATATLAPIALAGPPMKVGSTYRYFDGALLDAVPNEGPFLMGHGGQDDPEHQVTVSDFWIYSVEVSNQMYAWCVNSGKCTPPDPKDNPKFTDPNFVNYPVVGVNWQQATDYCGFVHGRLPTEAEWEKTASWDPVKQVKNIYPWGDKSPVCDLLNFRGCLNKSAPIVNYIPGQSAYGALNMAGNVFEWVGDWYVANYYGAAPTQDPTGPQLGTKRSVRSSAFNTDAFLTETARRFSAQPTDHRPDLGFRCVVMDPTYFAPFCTVSVVYGANAPGAGNGLPASQNPCPNPSVTQNDYCGNNNTPLANITINNSPPTVLSNANFDSCLPSGNEDPGTIHTCAAGNKIHIDASCPIQPPGSPSCPAGYSPDPSNPKQCVSSGGPGQCPTGYGYDQSLQCCSAVPGTNAQAPLCDAGEHLFQGVCVPDGVGPVDPAPIDYVVGIGLTCTKNPTCDPATDPSCGGSCPQGTHYGCTQNTYAPQCGCLPD